LIARLFGSLFGGSDEKDTPKTNSNNNRQQNNRSRNNRNNDSNRDRPRRNNSNSQQRRNSNSSSNSQQKRNPSSDSSQQQRNRNQRNDKDKSSENDAANADTAKRNSNSSSSRGRRGGRRRKQENVTHDVNNQTNTSSTENNKPETSNQVAKVVDNVVPEQTSKSIESGQSNLTVQKNDDSQTKPVTTESSKPVENTPNNKQDNIKPAHVIEPEKDNEITQINPNTASVRPLHDSSNDDDRTDINRNFQNNDSSSQSEEPKAVVAVVENDKT
jgi:hypothetical protein